MSNNRCFCEISSDCFPKHENVCPCMVYVISKLYKEENILPLLGYLLNRCSHYFLEHLLVAILCLNTTMKLLSVNSTIRCKCQYTPVSLILTALANQHPWSPWTFVGSDPLWEHCHENQCQHRVGTEHSLVCPFSSLPGHNTARNDLKMPEVWPSYVSLSSFIFYKFRFTLFYTE